MWKKKRMKCGEGKIKGESRSERVAMLLQRSGHGQFRGGKFSPLLRRFLSVSSQEEVPPGRSIPGVSCVCRGCVTYACVREGETRLGVSKWE